MTEVLVASSLITAVWGSLIERRSECSPLIPSLRVAGWRNVRLTDVLNSSCWIWHAFQKQYIVHQGPLLAVAKEAVGINMTVSLLHQPEYPGSCQIMFSGHVCA